MHFTNPDSFVSQSPIVILEKGSIEMSFVVQPLTEKDGEEWARLYYQAFKTVLSYLWLSEPSDESYKEMAIGNIMSLEEPDTYVFKAIDTTENKIVGIAQWQIFTEPPSEKVLQSMFTEVSESSEVDSEKRKGLLDDVVQVRREIMSLEPCVLLRLMMVLPEYQRKGIGHQLMQWGIEQQEK
jgi:GNAT superfamily N-acetyltransferase